MSSHAIWYCPDAETETDVQLLIGESLESSHVSPKSGKDTPNFENIVNIFSSFVSEYVNSFVTEL